MSQSQPADDGPGRLRANAVGAAGIVFFVVAAASPLSAALGTAPAVIGAGNGVGAPGAYLIVGLVLLLFSVGYAAMSRHVTGGGGFAAYVEAAFGPRAGRGAAYLATLAYMAMQAGLYGVFGFFAHSVSAAGLGWDVPWPWWSFGAMVAVGILAYREIDLSARILGVLMIAEVVVLLVVSIAIVAAGGESGLPLTSFTPAAVSSGALGIALMFAFASYIGFEATAIYSEEARDPARTVPRATYVSVVLITAFLVFTLWSFVVGHGVDQVVADAQQQPDDFVLGLSTRYVGPVWTEIMSVLLVTSFFAALLAFHNTIARYLLALSRRGWGPAPLARTHPRFQSPHVAGVVQSLVGAVIVALFVLTGQDPYSSLFLWMVGLGTLGVIVLQAGTSIGVIVFFRRRRLGESAWRAVIAPALGGIGLMTAAALALLNWPVLVGTDDTVPLLLPLLVPLAVVVGVALGPGRRKATGPDQTVASVTGGG